MKFRERPLMVYAIMLLAIIGSGYLITHSEGFFDDIMLELIGAVFFILIIDQLLLRSQRKRWRIVKNEIEHILSRTLNILRDDILVNMFSYKPELALDRGDLEAWDVAVRQHKAETLEKILQMGADSLFNAIREDYLFRGYEDLFLEKAEDLWRILNAKHIEHLAPEEVKLFLALHLHLRDLHAGIKNYQKSSQENDKSEYYRKKGRHSIIHNTRQIVSNLIELRKLGYQPGSVFVDVDHS